MNGAVNSQIRAQTTQEKKQMCRCGFGTTSVVHVNSTACDTVVEINEIIAIIILKMTTICEPEPNSHSNSNIHSISSIEKHQKEKVLSNTYFPLQSNIVNNSSNQQ